MGFRVREVERYEIENEPVGTDGAWSTAFRVVRESQAPYDSAESVDSDSTTDRPPPAEAFRPGGNGTNPTHDSAESPASTPTSPEGTPTPTDPVDPDPHATAPTDSAESVEEPVGDSPADDDPVADSPHLDDLSELAELSEEDFVEELGSRIVRVAAHAAALEYRLLVLIAEFDRREGWASGGYRDCAAWLEMYTGMNRVTARERVRMAQKLGDLPRISESMAQGELSYSKVRALVRVATPENEAELLPMAGQSTARQLEKEVAHYRELQRFGDLDADRRRHAKRHLRVGPLPDGMVQIRGRIAPEVGALLMKVLDAASDALFQGEMEWSPEAGHWGLAAEEVTPDQRWADALHLVLDRAMAAGFGGVVPEGADHGEPSDPDSHDSAPPDSAESPADGAAAGAERATDVADSAESAGESSDSPTRPCGCVPPSPSAERYLVMVNVDEAVLVGESAGTGAAGGTRALEGLGALGAPGTLEAHGASPEAGATAADRATGDHATGVSNGRSAARCDLDGSVPIPPATARRLACDGSIVRIVRGARGEVLDVGRKTRVVPPAIRRALWSRDGGCRFPGCGSRYAEAHHIVSWASGGHTKLDNLVLLCRAHHRGVHEGGFKVRMGRDRLPRFLNRAGVKLPAQRPPARVPRDPVADLVRTHRFRGIDLDAWTGTSRRRPSEGAWLRFQEALDPSE